MIPDSVVKKLEEIDYLVTEQQIDTESIDSETTILRGRIQFIDGSSLHFMEYRGSETHDYRFQWMDQNKSLIRRWDNAHHHQDLENFPFHVHTPEKVRPSREMTLSKVLEKVQELILEEIKD